MRRFFWPDIAGRQVAITGTEAKHISRVLRMQPGDMLILFDGSGVDCIGTITRIGAESVVVDIIERKPSDRELPVRIVLFQAVLKSDHLDYAIQKCTEAGVYRFMPFISERCEKRPDEKAARKLVERENRIALEAAKQCGRSIVPEVTDILPFREAAKAACSLGGTILVAYEDEKKRTLKRALKKAGSMQIALFIGPEGGFSKEEISVLKEYGAVSCSLGKRILRAETAGLAAAAMIGYEFMEKE